MNDQVLALRVASRFARPNRVSNILMWATEFDSPEALKNYLHEHPNADKSKHHVKKHEDGEHKEEKKSWKDKLKSLSSKAQNFLKEAPAAVKKFCEDENHRRKVLQDTSASLEKMPEKAVKQLIDTVKHEVHEFKEAGAGIKAVLSGQKMNDHQKKALKTVAFHVGLTVAATALTVSGGPLAGAVAFGKSMVKHVAMKAASSALGHLHVLEEMGHIGHGIHHILDKLAAEQADPDQVMVQYVTALVAKELQKLDTDSLGEVLEDSVEDGEKGSDKEASSRVLRRFLTAR